MYNFVTPYCHVIHLRVFSPPHLTRKLKPDEMSLEFDRLLFTLNMLVSGLNSIGTYTLYNYILHESFFFFY